MDSDEATQLILRLATDTDFLTKAEEIVNYLTELEPLPYPDRDEAS